MKKLVGILAGTILLVGMGMAQADSLKFFSGTTGYSGPFNGAGTVYNSIQSNTTVCANNGACGADVITASQVYGVGTDGLTATANLVWDDNAPAFGGLGVSTDGNDNISGTEILTITFNVPVQLTGIATLFDSGHGPFGNLSNMSGAGSETFLLNGVAQRFDLANLGLLNLATASVFTFAENCAGGCGVNNTSFYVSGLSFLPGQSISPTPIPGAVWLFGSGIGGLVMLARRKKAATQAAA